MKAIEVQCPLCGDWVHYGSPNAGKVTAKRRLYLKHVADREYVMKALRGHFRSVHRDKLLEWFPFTDRKCPVCGQQFSRKLPDKFALSGYLSHLLGHHPDELNAKLQAEGLKPLVADQLEMRDVELPEPQMSHYPNLSPGLPPASVAPPAPVQQEINTLPTSPGGGGDHIPPPPTPQPQPVVVAAPPRVEIQAEPAAPIAPEITQEEGDYAVDRNMDQQPRDASVGTTTPRTDAPEGFKQELIFDFLKRRVEPFHGGRKPKKPKEAPASAPKKRKGFNWGMLLPIAAVGGIFLLLWRKRHSQQATSAASPQASPQSQAMASQDVPTLDTAPSQEIPQAPQRQRGAYFDESGRFHSSKYPDQDII